MYRYYSKVDHRGFGYHIDREHKDWLFGIKSWREWGWWDSEDKMKEAVLELRKKNKMVIPA